MAKVVNPTVQVGDCIHFTYIENEWWRHKYLGLQGYVTEIHEDGTLSGTWGENFIVNPEVDEFYVGPFEEPAPPEPDPIEDMDIEVHDEPGAPIESD